MFGKQIAKSGPMNQSFSTHPYLCSELVTIAREPFPVVAGNLEAIGQWSALVLTQTPIRRNTEVTIRTKGHSLKGIVEWCTFDEPLGCYLEVRLMPESQWTKQWFQPEHLLALGNHTEAADAKQCA